MFLRRALQQAEGQQAGGGATGTQTTTQTAGQQQQQQTTQTQASEWKAPSKDEWEKFQKELAEVRKEAAERRVAAKTAEEKASQEAAAKATAEKAKAEAEGRIADVLRIEREERARIQKELDDAKRAAAEAEPYKATVANEVKSLREKLGDKAASVAGLSDAQALPILKQLEALSAGPGAAKTTTSGAPKPAAQPLPDITNMTPDEIRKLPKEQRDALLKELRPNSRTRSIRSF